MSGNRIDGHLIVGITGLLIAFVVAIPAVYSFPEKRFFWETNQADKIQQQQIILIKDPIF